MNWFKSWFNTPYYHTLYKNRDFNEAKILIDNIVGHLSLPEDSKIMDMACGKGRFSIYLNQLGFDVTGIDLSEYNISQAKIHETKNLNFRIHDFRFPLAIHEFDAIFNLFTSFGYLDSKEENLSVFKTVHDQLKDEGLFIFDYLNVVKAKNNLVDFQTKTIDGYTFEISKRIENETIIKEISFQENEENLIFEERVKYLTYNDFTGACHDYGFKILSVFGDYHLNEFDLKNSDRLILILRK